MKDILAAIAPSLRALGFNGSGQNYRMVTGESVLVINFQKGRGGDRFYINLGVQPLLIPSESGWEWDAKTIKECECVFRTRVNPPNEALGWSDRLDPNEIEGLRAKLREAIEAHLLGFAQFPGRLTELTPAAFLAREPASIYGGPHARKSLHFARIAFARGDPQRARAFAQLGLERCPPSARLLGIELNSILEEATGVS